MRGPFAAALGQMNGYTRLVLTGRSLVAMGAVTDLARALLPAVVVLEDVDLVAEERSLGPASSPVLFDLLDAMDGAAPDADLLFLLTTNRADLLEPALAARPGRIDVAVEIALPDAPARLGVGVDPADLPAGGALAAGPGRAGPMVYGRRPMPRRFGRYGG